MMEERVGCPACGYEFVVAEGLAGVMVECPGCGMPFEVSERQIAGGADVGRQHAVPVVPATEPETPTTQREPRVWDLPEASPPTPRAAIGDEEGRQFKFALAVAIAVGVIVVSLVLAWRFKSARPGLAPPPEMHGMNEDVEVGDFRFRVTDARWRHEKSPEAGGTPQRVLDVHLSVTNLDTAARVVPVITLGDRYGKSLAAEVGAPVFKTAGDTPVIRLDPGRPVRGHLVFQPRSAEYCLIVSGGEGGGTPQTGRIRLRARSAPTGP